MAAESIPLTHAEIAAELESAAIFERRVLQSLNEQAVSLRAPTHDFIVDATLRRIAALEVTHAYFRTLAGLTEAAMSCGPLGIIAGGRA